MTTELKDAAFHLKNAERSLIRAANDAKTEEVMSDAEKLADVAKKVRQATDRLHESVK